VPGAEAGVRERDQREDVAGAAGGGEQEAHRQVTFLNRSRKNRQVTFLMSTSHKNLGALLRDLFRELADHVHVRLAEHGHPQIRVAHGNVLQFLDDEGTRVSVLADRARMTKQSMGELVAHLEAHGYVERVPDPSDGRAKLVRATRSGRATYPLAREAIAEVEARWAERIGERRLAQLRELLEELDAGR
jgi:DNA-binding MarR family transcriptional regulator